MRILNIKLHNFKSFTDTFIDFENDIPIGFTHLQGNIGAGKTSIGEAILYGLYGRVRNKNINQLLSWGAKKGHVEIQLLDKNNQPLTIFRELRHQGQSDFMVTKSDGSIIDGSSKQDIQSTLEENHYDVPAHIMDMFCIISFNNFKSLSQLSTKDTKILLDELLSISSISQHNQEKIDQLNQDLLKSIKDKSKIEATQDLFYPKITISLILNKQKEENLTKLKEKQAELKILQKNEKLLKGKSVCPTCHHPLDNVSIDTISGEISTLYGDIEELEHTIANIDIKIQKIKEEYDENYEKPLEEINKQITSIQQQISLLEHQSSTQFISEGLNKTLLQSKKENIEKELISLGELSNQLQTQIRKQIISHFTPIINQKIVNYTTQLQLNYIPFFDDNFDCFIKTSSSEVVDISSLSTGQTKLVDMVVILSIITTILYNNNINIIFLDELFTNLNSDIKYKLIEILKKELSNKQIIAISHETFPEYLVDKIIKIKYNYPQSELII